MRKTKCELVTWRPKAVMESRERCPPALLEMDILAWSLVALVAMFCPPAIGQPAVIDFLDTLNLSSYPPGMQPPEFRGHTTAGQVVSLAELRGKVILLNFWATWCPTCRTEMPVFEHLHREFAGEGLTVLGVNIREGIQTIQEYARELNLTFPLLLDTQGEITASYGVIGIPTTFLIGRDGRPVALAVGSRQWESVLARTLIQTLLAEPAVQKETQ